jgi:hypothetical protein
MLLRGLASAAILLAVVACATPPDRPAVSSYGCMLVVRESIAPQHNDKRAHCLTAGRIAQRCSAFEADLAGIGKEFSDIFNHGDPSWADWRADRAGIRCARHGRDPQQLAECCTEAGY